MSGKFLYAYCVFKPARVLEFERLFRIWVPTKRTGRIKKQLAEIGKTTNPETQYRTPFVC